VRAAGTQGWVATVSGVCIVAPERFEAPSLSTRKEAAARTSP